MTLTRLICPTCADDTLHAGMTCIHCGNVLPAPSMLPKQETYRELSDGQRLNAQSMRRGGKNSTGKRA